MKVVQNYHCNECEHYINQILIPQLESCKYDMDSLSQCKFDSDLFVKNASCFYGMKKKVLENLIGANYWYSVKKRKHSPGRLFNLVYGIQSERLIEIYNVSNLSELQNSNVKCLNCDLLYEKIRKGDRLKKMDFDEFHERYKGCFYGKVLPQLVASLNLQNQIKEDDFNYSYNKIIRLGKNEVLVNFLFYPGEKIIDIRVVDSISNMVIN